MTRESGDAGGDDATGRGPGGKTQSRDPPPGQPHPDNTPAPPRSDPSEGPGGGPFSERSPAALGTLGTWGRRSLTVSTLRRDSLDSGCQGPKEGPVLPCHLVPWVLGHGSPGGAGPRVRPQGPGSKGWQWGGVEGQLGVDTGLWEMLHGCAKPGASSRCHQSPGPGPGEPRGPGRSPKPDSPAEAWVRPQSPPLQARCQHREPVLWGVASAAGHSLVLGTGQSGHLSREEQVCLQLQIRGRGTVARPRGGPRGR